MTAYEKSTKDVYIHVGPHKTGTTAIQQYLVDHTHFLEANKAKYFAAGDMLNIQRDIARGDRSTARKNLIELASIFSDYHYEKYIISQEDFSGDLPGRTSGRVQVYPEFLTNLQFLEQALAPHRVQFLVFLRPIESWLKSVYAQHLRFRDRHKSFEQFTSEIEIPQSWGEIVKGAADHYGDRIRFVDYTCEPRAGIDALLDWVGVARPWPEAEYVVNASPSQDLLAEFERINALADHKNLVSIYKQRAVRSFDEPPRYLEFGETVEWPPGADTLPVAGLEGLSRRVANRIGKQGDAEDLLPWLQVDLDQAAKRIIPADSKMPDASRRKMSDQVEILRYHLRGKSELALLHGLSISYLRRDTPYTARASALFHRLWTEKGNQLAYELSSRWLISAFQTFADHGMKPVQREIGYAGFFYGNMMKIYEGERAIEQRDSDAIYENTKPQRGKGFRGLDRYVLGGTDLLLNTNAMALQVASKDAVAGLPLIEFLIRTKSSPTVFSRMDRSRKAHNIEVQGFSDTWSFFEEPK